ncbi:hypothetical protein DOTSEDRAFT_49623 [Dothistroma septosporum NZE10]|uniref:Uncharacterized protein n=1 Tax=Dothistroma septosporum (strain NZE10 / CBS 128990) TaxID=675120 RepID=N1Q0Y4_DOTSN|nr:hypothetical protein DOTSEDRAFT_49623 [Dothistroma septosporum NZE10]
MDYFHMSSVALANKIKQIKIFRVHSESGNTQSESNVDHIILVESALQGALAAMASDWTFEQTYLKALLHAEGSVTMRYSKRLGYDIDSWKMPMIVLDLGKTTPKQAIHAKIEGHGIDDINLLEIELEMYTTQLIGFGSNQLLRATEKAAHWSEEDSDQLRRLPSSTIQHIVEGAKEGDSGDVAQNTDSPADVEAFQIVNDVEDLLWTGVCPATQKDLSSMVFSRKARCMSRS